MRAGHLDDQGALELVAGLGALDECLAGVHSNLAEHAIQKLASRQCKLSVFQTPGKALI